ncbi:hypothetical protein BJV74DRAFT_868338 [Russula compacta]|nr:hypothetical protein BJV74DRAFT_868338 [Russula compacta]
MAPQRSTLQVFEGPRPAPVTQNEDLTYIGMKSTHNWPQEGVTTNVPSDQALRCAHADTIPDLSVPSTVPAVSCTQEQRSSQGRPQKVRKTRKGLASASSRTRRSRLPAGPDISEAPKGLFSCDLCRKGYVQLQGLRRHYREKHAASSCEYCDDFKWGRPYLFKEHLEKRHPHVNADVTPEAVAGVRCSATTAARYPPQQGASPPTSEHDRWGSAEPQLHPLVPPALAVAKLPSVCSAPCDVRTEVEALRRMQKVGEAPGRGLHRRRSALGFGVAEEVSCLF